MLSFLQSMGLQPWAAAALAARNDGVSMEVEQLLQIAEETSAADNSWFSAPEARPLPFQCSPSHAWGCAPCPLGGGRISIKNSSALFHMQQGGHAVQPQKTTAQGSSHGQHPDSHLQSARDLFMSDSGEPPASCSINTPHCSHRPHMLDVSCQFCL